MSRVFDHLPGGTTGELTYVALGDSFTEGMNDPAPDDPDRYIGWADRFAAHLTASRPGLRYANLAVRGKLLRQIAADQVPLAIEMRPDLVTICGGGNDMIRPGGDPDGLAIVFDQAVRDLSAAGAHVVLFTGFDPRGLSRGSRFRGQAATFNMHLRAIADRRGATVVDLWPRGPLHDPQAWSEDRLHLTPEGHRRVALKVCDVLGVPAEGSWLDPWPPFEEADWLTRRRDDLHWTRAYFLPWVRRRIQGRSSGDGRSPKRPDARPL